MGESKGEAGPRHVLVLAGDGIGPEVTQGALRILEHLAERAGLNIHLTHDLAGGACYDRHGEFLRDDTLEAARNAHAILFGAEGGPAWDDLEIEGGPTARSGLSRLRKELDLYANVRPVRAWPGLAHLTPFVPERIEGADLIIVRELTGGVYFGEPRGIATHRGETRAVDTQVYTESEIERIASFAMALASRRQGLLTSVDKANVMETGVLWRRVASAAAARDYPDLTLEHLYADNCLFQLVTNPRRFDVIVADNLFGDLLSDCAAAIAGSLGMLPSASFGPAKAGGKRLALYEPVHGSAPDIAGRNIANPMAAILSVAMMLDTSFGRPDLARRIENAIESVLRENVLTRDLGGTASGDEMTEAILAALT